MSDLNDIRQISVSLRPFEDILEFNSAHMVGSDIRNPLDFTPHNVFESFCFLVSAPVIKPNFKCGAVLISDEYMSMLKNLLLGLQSIL